MSNSNGHRSASQRYADQLEQRIAEYEVMQSEFSLLLNYLVKMNGGVYRLFKADLVVMGPPLIVRTERKFHKREHPEDAHGECIEYTLCDPAAPSDAPRIIVPS